MKLSLQGKTQLLATAEQVYKAYLGLDFGMAQKPPVLVNIMHAGFYPNVLPFRHEYYDSIAL